MSKLQIQTEIDIQTLLSSAAKWKIAELESFVQELNGVIFRKNAPPNSK